jgi:hypothetical protein
MTATTAGTEPSLIETATSQFLGMALISLPNDIGAITLCPLSSSEAWPPNHWTAPRIQQCIGLRVVWGVPLPVGAGAGARDTRSPPATAMEER